MKALKYLNQVVSLLSLILIIGLTTSCKKEPGQDEYRKILSEKAKQDNMKCKDGDDNETYLKSVLFEDSILTYTFGLSDKAIVTVDVKDSTTRKNIIARLSDKMKEYMVKGNCRLIYKYVSPHDSSSIEILPDELARALQEKSRQ